jgi:hypothetical protein
VPEGSLISQPDVTGPVYIFTSGLYEGHIDTVNTAYELLDRWTLDNGTDFDFSLATISDNINLNAHWEPPNRRLISGVEINDAANVLTAFDAVNDSGSNYYNFTLLLSSDIAVPASIFELTRNNIDLRIYGLGNNTRTLSLDGDAQGWMFSVGQIGRTGILLHIGNNITLRGFSDNNDAVVRVNSQALFGMFPGSTITGNISTGRSGGGVYVANDAEFSMYGGTISGNTSDEAGGVKVDAGGRFFMYGGRITGNTGIINPPPPSTSVAGGGVLLNGDGANFSKSGNSIIENNRIMPFGATTGTANQVFWARNSPLPHLQCNANLHAGTNISTATPTDPVWQVVP